MAGVALALRAVTVGGLAVLASSVAPASGVRPQARALAAVAPGAWTLREGGVAVETLCVRDPKAFLQLQHRGLACSHALTEDTATAATSYYDCPGHGDGRTVLHLDTPQALRIDTQGVRDGLPFSRDIEARHAGACPAS